MNTILIPLFVVLALGVAAFSLAVPQGGARWWAWAAAVVGLVVVSRLAPAGMGATVMAALAELAAIGLVWSRGTQQARAAARQMAMAVGTGIVLVWAGEHLLAPTGGADLGAQQIAVALLIIGFALKLGLAPAYFWLPAVARASTAMTTAVIVAIVDVNVFCELLDLHAHAPWMFSEYRAVWLSLALLTLLGGALLALAQTELKPMLAFSTIDDMGYLLLGLTLGTAAGMSGAWLGIISHALAKLVLFGAVGAAEWHLGQPVTLNTRGLAARLPVASAAFMLGALAFLAVPPTVGFIGRWRLYLAGAELGGAPVLLLLFAASAIGLLCYVRAIHRTWLGAPAETPPGRPLPWVASAVLLAFAVAPVALGLIPAVLQQPAPAAAHAVVERSLR
jgi:multicomponent Na+:H+ antiporter subunit D